LEKLREEAWKLEMFMQLETMKQQLAHLSEAREQLLTEESGMQERW
jgi:hypothetical protein